MFKFFVICVLLAATAHAERRRFGHARSSFPHTTSKPVAVSSDHIHSKILSSPSNNDIKAKVLSAASDVRPDGFDYHLAISNGISHQASGDDYGRIHGGFQWISPEGEHIAFSYVADENGYRPNIALLPTPPPIPEAILKSLQYIESHPHKDESYQHHYHHEQQQEQQQLHRNQHHNKNRIL